MVKSKDNLLRWLDVVEQALLWLIAAGMVLHVYFAAYFAFLLGGES